MFKTVAVLTGCAAVVVAGAAFETPGVALTALPGSVSPMVGAGDRVGAVSGSQQLTIQVWLKPDLEGAARFASAVSTPGSREFHRYLSPNAYTARFGPSAAQATAVSGWLADGGLTDVRVSSGRDYVSASGPVSTVQSVLDVRVNQYRVAGQGGTTSVVQTNDRAVSVPASLAPEILGVTGLSNFRAAGTRAAGTRAASVTRQPTCSRSWAEHVRTFAPAYRGLTKASLPICGYTARQLRAAYGVTGAFTGRGQTVALTESAAPTAMFRTLREYARRNHLQAPKPSQYREIQVGGSDECGQSSRNAEMYNNEAEMDSQAVYAMAPNANQLMVVGSGCDEDQALLNATLAVLTGDGHRPSASIVSNSWQIPLGDLPPKTVHAIALRAAAEGVGLYFASGDTPGLTTTAADPFVTAVGGTTLGLDALGRRVFETGWSNNGAILEDGKWSDLGITGAGGGTSLDHPQPAYQKGVVPPSMSHVRIGGRVAVNRTVPDISAVGDINSGMLTSYTALDDNGRPGRYQEQVNAGTSLSAPLIAGLVADAQQGRRTNFGFINPLLYRLYGTRAFLDVLPVSKSMPQQNRATYTPANATDSAALEVFDSQNPGYTDQLTTKGYDTTTGVGTPDGLAFLLGLRYGLGGHIG